MIIKKQGGNPSDKGTGMRDRVGSGRGPPVGRGPSMGRLLHVLMCANISSLYATPTPMLHMYTHITHLLHTHHIPTPTPHTPSHTSHPHHTHPHTPSHTPHQPTTHITLTHHTHTHAGVFISLRPLIGSLAKVKEENPLLFRTKYTAECHKLGFPEIIRPCELHLGEVWRRGFEVELLPPL